jgi:hypothetical protein
MLTFRFASDIHHRCGSRVNRRRELRDRAPVQSAGASPIRTAGAGSVTERGCQPRYGARL